MNVVLPEVDGRLSRGAISFKARAGRRRGAGIRPRSRARPEDVARKLRRGAGGGLGAAAAHARQRRRSWPASCRIIRPRAAAPAMPSGSTPRHSVAAIAVASGGEGYDATDAPADLIAKLQSGPVGGDASRSRLSRAVSQACRQTFARSVIARLGRSRQRCLRARWRLPFRVLRLGKILVALQPDRGDARTRKADYHDGALPAAPRLCRVLSLAARGRARRRADPLRRAWHAGMAAGQGGGAVGSLRAASRCSAPVPLIYPFIVNNPGEAAQAKRRSAAVTVGHLTPPLVKAPARMARPPKSRRCSTNMPQAQALDPRRAQTARRTHSGSARESSGLLQECGVARRRRRGADPARRLALRPQGHAHRRRAACVRPSPDGEPRRMLLASPDAGRRRPARRLRRAELHGCWQPCAAASSRRAPPARRRAAATRRAADRAQPLFASIRAPCPPAPPGSSASAPAQDFLDRYLQDHGDWPRRIVLDLWGSATMRTGGDDLAQALRAARRAPALGRRLDARQRLRDPAAGAARPPARRCDPAHLRPVPRCVPAADRAVRRRRARGRGARRSAGRQPAGAADRTALAVRRRARRLWRRRRALGARRTGSDRDELGASLSRRQRATPMAATRGARGTPANFARRVARRRRLRACAGSWPARTSWTPTPSPTHEGGFAAAAASLGTSPALYHPDATAPGGAQGAHAGEEIARVLRARATNPRWLDGQMRHGFRGAAEIAETVDNLSPSPRSPTPSTAAISTCCSTPSAATRRCATFLDSANPARGARHRRPIRTKPSGAVSGRTRRNSPPPILAEMRAAMRMMRRPIASKAGAPARCAPMLSGDGSSSACVSPAEVCLSLRARTFADLARALWQRRASTFPPAPICKCAVSAQETIAGACKRTRDARPARRRSRAPKPCATSCASPLAGLRPDRAARRPPASRALGGAADRRRGAARSAAEIRLFRRWRRRLAAARRRDRHWFRRRCDGEASGVSRSRSAASVVGQHARPSIGSRDGGHRCPQLPALARRQPPHGGAGRAARRQVGARAICSKMSPHRYRGADQSDLSTPHAVPHEFWRAASLETGSFVGAGLLFGRIEADALEPLAKARGGLRRGRVAPDALARAARGPLRGPARADLASAIGSARLSSSTPTDPRLAFAACPGAPACFGARRRARAWRCALAPASVRSKPGALHVSGCAKGCALHGRALTHCRRERRLCLDR